MLISEMAKIILTSSKFSADFYSASIFCFKRQEKDKNESYWGCQPAEEYIRPKCSTC